MKRKTKQNKTKQNKTKQNQTKQNKRDSQMSSEIFSKGEGSILTPVSLIISFCPVFVWQFAIRALVSTISDWVRWRAGRRAGIWSWVTWHFRQPLWAFWRLIPALSLPCGRSEVDTPIPPITNVGFPQRHISLPFSSSLTCCKTFSKKPSNGTPE